MTSYTNRWKTLHQLHHNYDALAAESGLKCDCMTAGWSNHLSKFGPPASNRHTTRLTESADDQLLPKR